MRLKSLYLLAVVASAVFAAGCALGPYRDPNYDPAWPTIEPVGDLETVGNLRPELLWYTETDEPMRSVPVLVGNVVYVSGDEQVYALNSDNGEVLWRFETEDDLDGKLVVADGVVYVAGDAGVLALDAASGELLWIHEMETGWSPPALAAAGGWVYVATEEGLVYGLDAASGELLWYYHFHQDSANRPTVEDGVVYVATSDGTVYALRAAAAH